MNTVLLHSGDWQNKREIVADNNWNYSLTGHSLLPMYITVRKLHQLPITAAAHSPAIAYKIAPQLKFLLETDRQDNSAELLKYGRPEFIIIIWMYEHRKVSRTTTKCFKFLSQDTSWRKLRNLFTWAPIATAMFTNSSLGNSTRGTWEGDLEVQNTFQISCHEYTVQMLYTLPTHLACLRNWTRQTGQPFQEQGQTKQLSGSGNQATRRKPR